MAHHVKEEWVRVAFLPQGLHLGAETTMNGDGDVQLLGFAPERAIDRVVQLPAIVRVRADEHRAHAQVLHHPAHLFYRFVHIL